MTRSRITCLESMQSQGSGLQVSISRSETSLLILNIAPRKIIGKNDFPYHFKKIVVRYEKIGYNINIMRQTACLVVNPVKVNSFAYLFNCTTVGRTSDRMMVPS